MSLKETEPSLVVGEVLRDSYGRLLAFLAVRSRDIALAEDVLADAFHAALESWPRNGVPDNPEAWLLTTARRKLIDASRHRRMEFERFPILAAEMTMSQEMDPTPDEFPDERVGMLFLCAHPAIDEAVRTPLMLQVVLGLDAARIASAFLMQPSAMGQRLSRAKTKIRDAGIRFELPPAERLPARLKFVLDAIYVAFNAGWEETSHRVGGDLTLEAISLGALLVEHFPGEPEVLGLQSLMLFCHSRRSARLSPIGDYVPLSEQDPLLWSSPLIERAEALLGRAAALSRVGRFQFEAAIQSVHANRRRMGFTAWSAIALLYEGLLRVAPNTGAYLGQAAAVAEAEGPEAGWRLIAHLDPALILNHQPYWALKAHLFKAMGRKQEAREAYARAIGLATNPSAREFLNGKLNELCDKVLRQTAD